MTPSWNINFSCFLMCPIISGSFLEKDIKDQTQISLPFQCTAVGGCLGSTQPVHGVVGEECRHGHVHVTVPHLATEVQHVTVLLSI